MLKDFDVEETGTTFEENAILKSEAAAKRLNKRVIADDSGLEVLHLTVSQGCTLTICRFRQNDDDNIDKLLSKLTDITQREAQFVCVISMSEPDQPTRTFKGTVSGRITDERRGDNGFGYDPVFYVPEKGRTMAELSATEKVKLVTEEKL